MKDWELSFGFYPGILTGFRTYREERKSNSPKRKKILKQKQLLRYKLKYLKNCRKFKTNLSHWLNRMINQKSSIKLVRRFKAHLKKVKC